MIVKTKTFNIPCAWTARKIIDHYLPSELQLGGGYIGEKRRKVKITVIVDAERKKNEPLQREK